MFEGIYIYIFIPEYCFLFYVILTNSEEAKEKEKNTDAMIYVNSICHTGGARIELVNGQIDSFV